MKKEDVKNKEDFIDYILLELYKKVHPVKFGAFFLETLPAGGIDSFKHLLNELHEQGMVTKSSETGAGVPGFPALQTVDLRYSISLKGIDFLKTKGRIPLKQNEDTNQTMGDILNKVPESPKFDGDPYKVAATYLDKIFRLIPAYSGFKISDIIHSANLPPKERIIAEYLHDKMEYILKTEGCLETHSQYGNLVLQLNSHGRDVLTTGGLTAYKNRKQQTTKPSIINNIHQGDNYGNVVQSGDQPSLDLNTTNQLQNSSLDTSTTNKHLPKIKSRFAPVILWISNHIIQIIVGIIATVVGGYILFRMGWLG